MSWLDGKQTLDSPVIKGYAENIKLNCCIHGEAHIYSKNMDNSLSLNKYCCSRSGVQINKSCCRFEETHYQSELCCEKVTSTWLSRGLINIRTNFLACDCCGHHPCCPILSIILPIVLWPLLIPCPNCSCYSCCPTCCICCWSKDENDNAIMLSCCVANHEELFVSIAGPKVEQMK